MTVHAEVDSATGETVLRFTLAGDIHEGPVSVVGSFNQWTPRKDVLEPQADGTRSVTVTVEPNTDVHFRYLGSGGTWFDDPDTEATEYGSIIRAEARRPTAPEPTSTKKATSSKIKSRPR